LVACLLLPQAILAAGPKPDFAFKSKVVGISFTLDDKIKADPALAADCRAEGRKWATRRRIDAEKMHRESPGSFSNGAWAFERNYTMRSVVNGRYVSIVRDDYEYAGGAHPNRSADTILWDKTARKRISIRPFFLETADDGATLKAMRQGVIASLKLEKKARGAEGADLNLIEGIEPKLLKIGPVSLAPSTESGKSAGLTFHYAPYVVGSYAEGSYVAFVPWETLKPYLTPEGMAIFAGARPKGDDDGQR
jgi:hypothetical protein